MLSDVGEQLVPKMNCPIEVADAKRATDTTLPVIEVQAGINPVLAAVVEPEVMRTTTGVDPNRQMANGHDQLLLLSCCSVRNVSERRILGTHC